MTMNKKTMANFLIGSAVGCVVTYIAVKHIKKVSDDNEALLMLDGCPEEIENEMDIDISIDEEEKEEE